MTATNDDVVNNNKKFHSYIKKSVRNKKKDREWLLGGGSDREESRWRLGD